MPSHRVFTTLRAVVFVLPFVCGTYAHAQQPSGPADSVAKEAYVSLVKTMREDEFFLIAHKHGFEQNKHAYHPRCVANLRASQFTKPLAWILQWTLTEQEAQDAHRFFATETGRKWASRGIVRIERKLDREDPSLPQLSDAEALELARFAATPAGDKILMKEVHRKSNVVDTAWSEALHLVDSCTQALAGELQVVQCQSEKVVNTDESCTAQYSIKGRFGNAQRETQALYTCTQAGSAGSGLVVALPGQHQTIGLAWRDNRLLEVLIPAGVKPTYQDSERNPRTGVQITYRARRPDDPPATPCVAHPPLDEFGWPQE